MKLFALLLLVSLMCFAYARSKESDNDSLSVEEDDDGITPMGRSEEDEEDDSSLMDDVEEGDEGKREKKEKKEKKGNKKGDKKEKKTNLDKFGVNVFVSIDKLRKDIANGIVPSSIIEEFSYFVGDLLHKNLNAALLPNFNMKENTNVTLASDSNQQYIVYIEAK